MSIARIIDHTYLIPTATIADIDQLCSEAIKYRFASICIPPYFVSDAHSMLQGSAIPIATVIGFPFGYSHYAAKAAEIEQAIGAGAREVDVVMNLAAFRNNDVAFLETEIMEVLKITTQAPGRIITKLIIESGMMQEHEIIRCCDLYRHFPLDFLKTSTGYADKGATVEAVTTMRLHLPSTIQVKASGGIRSFEFAKSLVEAGASRLGTSSGVDIIKEEADWARLQ